MEYECSCGEILDIPPSLYGQQVECTGCGRVFRAAAPRGVRRVGRAFRDGISDIDRGIKRRLGSRGGAGGDELSPLELFLILVVNIFTFCIAGFILYFVWRDSRPGRAGQVITLTWLPLAVWVIVLVVFGKKIF